MAGSEHVYDADSRGGMDEMVKQREENLIITKYYFLTNKRSGQVIRDLAFPLATTLNAEWLLKGTGSDMMRDDSSRPWRWQVLNRELRSLQCLWPMGLGSGARHV